MPLPSTQGPDGVYLKRESDDNDIVTIAGLLKAEPSIEHMVLSDYLEEDWVSRALLSWRFVEYCPS